MIRGRGGRVALAVVVLVVVLVALAQALLPRIAASRVRDRVAAYGQVHSVQVSAFPALKLLWGHADSISIVAGRLAASPAQVASLLWQAQGVGSLDVVAAAAVLRAPLLPRGLEVGDVRVRKRGALLSASAILTPAQLAAALPAGVSAEPIASGSGAVEARASGALFGLQASLDVLVQAVEGRLVAEPRVPFGGIAAVTLFSDRHLKVLATGMRVLRSEPLSYEVTLQARLS
jgi:hypothetical protein